MLTRPPTSTRTYTLLPYTTLFRLLPALGEGGTQFLRLVGIQVAAEQQVMCHPGETANATMASGERGLERCQSERAAVGNMERHLARRLDQLVVRYDFDRKSKRLNSSH